MRFLIIAVTLSTPLFSASTALATTTVVRGTDPTKQSLKGSIVMADGRVLDGEVIVEGDAITCVAANCTDPAGASVFTITDAFIYPGFIDAHNHIAYNFLPKWTHRGSSPTGDSGRPRRRTAPSRPLHRDAEGASVRDGPVGRDRGLAQRNHITGSCLPRAT